MSRKIYSLLLAVPVAGLSLGAQTMTDSLNYTGAMQTYTVPCGVTSVFVEAYGAAGGDGAIGDGTSPGGTGGLGGYTSGNLSVTPGQTLYIYVGGAGITGTGGYNGGANGGTQNAGGGGGASDVRVNSSNVADRILVAGGGGGGGRGGCETGAVNGGNGGSGNGGNGIDGINSPDGGAGFGAIGTASGAAGVGCSGFLGQPGVAASNENGGTGGSGQSCCCFSFGSIPGGGGGGGGYLGGGGGGGGSAGTTGCSGNNKGGGGGGAGGSGYTDGASVTNPVVSMNMRNGDGVVKITYTSPTPALPVVSGNTAMCEGDNINYSVGSDPNANSYNWTVPSGLTLNSGQGSGTINVTGTTAGTYTITVEGVNTTCSLTGPTASYVVTVNALPVVTATSSASMICVGSSVTLDGTGAASYDWQPGSLTGATVTDFPSATTTYTVTGTDANGCMASAQTTVVVNPLPTVTVTAPTTTICDGDTLTVTGNGAATYDWQPVALTGTSIELFPSATSTYTVTGTDAFGCMNQAIFTIDVNALPTVSASGSPTTVCAGSPAVLTGSGASSYAWSSGGTSATETVTPAATTTYTVTGTDANGCSNTATVDVNVNPLPTVTVNVPTASVCVDDAAFALTGGSPAGGAWSGPGVSGSNFTPMTAGTGTATITYSYTDSNGCSASATDNVVVNACVGIVTVDPADAFSFSPNPATDLMTIQWGENVSVNKIDIVDVSGRVVMSEAVNGGNNAVLKVSSLPAGVYSLMVTGANGQSVYRFVKQ